MTDLISHKYLTVDELAELLRVKVHYIYNLTYTRQIPYLKIGRHLRFDLEQISLWIESKARKPEDLQKIKSDFPDGKNL